MAVTRPITHRVALPLTRRPVSPGVGMTDPLRVLIDSLFGNGEQGALFIPQPTLLGNQNLWQMSDGTVIADADGDPVGRNDDVSGNGTHATQSVSADRPLYQTDGSLHWLAFDGVGDALGVSFPAGISQPFTKITVASITNDNGRISGAGVGSDGQCWRASPTSVSMFAGNVMTLGGIDMTQTNVFVEIYNGANSELRAITSSYTASQTGNAGVGSLPGFSWAERDGSHFGQVDVYGGVVVAGIPSEDAIDAAVKYLAKLAGVTL